MINTNPSTALFFITKKNEEEEKDFEAGINGLRFQEMRHEASKSCAMSFYTVNRQDKFQRVRILWRIFCYVTALQVDRKSHT